MAFFDCHFFSDTLAMSVSAHVFLPQRTKRQIGMAESLRTESIPTLYLLHGLSDDHTIWSRRTSIERYAAGKGIAVVVPAVGRSFYQNMANGPQYWSYVSEELPCIMQRFFPLSNAREDNFTAGLSMGGYGAFRLALAQPERFCAAASLSGALDIEKHLRGSGQEDSRISQAEWQRIFGSDLSFSKSGSDLFHLAEKLTQSGITQPALYLCCGTEDKLLSDSRKFHQHLDSLDYPHTYSEQPGDHLWGYWDQQIQSVMDWLPIRQP